MTKCDPQRITVSRGQGSAKGIPPIPTAALPAYVPPIRRQSLPWRNKAPAATLHALPAHMRPRRCEAPQALDELLDATHWPAHHQKPATRHRFSAHLHVERRRVGGVSGGEGVQPAKRP